MFLDIGYKDIEVGKQEAKKEIFHFLEIDIIGPGIVKKQTNFIIIEPEEIDLLNSSTNYTNK